MLAVAALLAPAASRADTAPPVEATVAGQHFVVHYLTGGDPATVPRVSPETAHKVLADAGAAYDFYTSRLGLPPPVGDDAMSQLPGRRAVRAGGMSWAAPWWDGKVDIYLVRLSGGVLGRALSGSPAVSTAPGMFALDYRATARTTAHELFHLIQFAIFRRATLDILLGEGMANWAAYQFVAHNSSLAASSAAALGALAPASLRLPWSSLDCRADCGSGNRSGGYDQWPFFELLSERYGNGVIKEILQRSAALGALDGKPHGLESLSGVLRDHGSSLAEAFAQYTAARLDGSFSHPLLAGKTMAVNGRLVAPRRQTRSMQLIVNHLAARAIVLRVPGASGSRCRSRRLRLSVTGPPGSVARSYVTAVGGEARPLRQEGDRAGLVVRLLSCSRAPRLAVANPSANGDGQAFTVTARALRARHR